MITIKKIISGDFPLYICPQLKSNNGIIFCFTTRHGGFSKGRFRSLNVDYRVGDSGDNVKRNRKMILKKIGPEGSERIYSIKQVHGTGVLNINKNNELKSDNISKEADCIITSLQDTPVMVMGADCNLILIADIFKRVVAAVHAGWKGTLNEMISRVILFMREKLKSENKNIFVSFGPSIRSCCYMVEDSMLKKFIERFGNKGFFLKRNNNFFLDLVKINYLQLEKLGIDKKNISDCGECTCCNPDFFSYRRDKITGRQAGVAIIESG